MSLILSDTVMQIDDLLDDSSWAPRFLSTNDKATATKMAQVFSACFFSALAIYLVFSNSTRLSYIHRASLEKRLQVVTQLCTIVAAISAFLNFYQMTEVDNFKLPGNRSGTVDTARPVEWILTCPLMQLCLVLMGGSRIPESRLFWMPMSSLGVLSLGACTLFVEEPYVWILYGCAVVIHSTAMFFNRKQIIERSQGAEGLLSGDSEFRKATLILMITWFPFPAWYFLSPEGIGYVTDNLMVQLGWAALNVVSKFTLIFYLQRIKDNYCNRLKVRREMKGALAGVAPDEELDSDDDRTVKSKVSGELTALVVETMNYLGMAENVERFLRLLYESQVCTLPDIEKLTEMECEEVQLPWDLVFALKRRTAVWNLEMVDEAEKCLAAAEAHYSDITAAKVEKNADKKNSSDTGLFPSRSEREKDMDAAAIAAAQNLPPIMPGVNSYAIWPTISSSGPNMPGAPNDGFSGVMPQPMGGQTMPGYQGQMNANQMYPGQQFNPNTGFDPQQANNGFGPQGLSTGQMTPGNNGQMAPGYPQQMNQQMNDQFPRKMSTMTVTSEYSPNVPAGQMQNAGQMQTLGQMPMFGDNTAMRAYVTGVDSDVMDSKLKNLESQLLEKFEKKFEIVMKTALEKAQKASPKTDRNDDQIEKKISRQMESCFERMIDRVGSGLHDIRSSMERSTAQIEARVENSLAAQTRENNAYLEAQMKAHFDHFSARFEHPLDELRETASTHMEKTQKSFEMVTSQFMQMKDAQKDMVSSFGSSLSKLTDAWVERITQDSRANSFTLQAKLGAMEESYKERMHHFEDVFMSKMRQTVEDNTDQITKTMGQKTSAAAQELLASIEASKTTSATESDKLDAKMTQAVKDMKQSMNKSVEDSYGAFVNSVRLQIEGLQGVVTSKIDGKFEGVRGNMSQQQSHGRSEDIANVIESKFRETSRALDARLRENSEMFSGLDGKMKEATQHQKEHMEKAVKEMMEKKMDGVEKSLRESFERTYNLQSASVNEIKAYVSDVAQSHHEAVVQVGSKTVECSEKLSALCEHCQVRGMGMQVGSTGSMATSEDRRYMMQQRPGTAGSFRHSNDGFPPPSPRPQHAEPNNRR